MMKIRVPIRPLPDHPNNHRPISRYALYLRYISSLFVHQPHMPRRKLWLTPTKYTRQNGLLLFPLHLFPHRPRIILRLLHKKGGLKSRRYPPSPHHANSFRRVRSPMGPNVILRSNSDHKPCICSPLYRNINSPMTLRRILS